MGHLFQTSLAERFADFPVVAEGIDDSADSPVIRLIIDGPDDCRTRSYGTREHGVRVGDDEDQAHGRASESLGTEVLVFGRFVGDPEFGAIDRELGYDSTSRRCGTTLLRRRRPGRSQRPCLRCAPRAWVRGKSWDLLSGMNEAPGLMTRFGALTSSAWLLLWRPASRSWPCAFRRPSRG